MAHSRSAKKRVRQSEARRAANRAVKARFRSQLKKVLSLAGTKGDGVEKEFRLLSKWLDKAAARNVIHRNAAARTKSRVAARIRALAAAKT
jgi:small subunit ribosomal protein S20